MTSHELAKKLLEMPDVIVTVSGYEGGVDELTSIEPVKELHLNVNDAWYYGKHEYNSSRCEGGCIHKKTMAIHLD